MEGNHRRGKADHQLEVSFLFFYFMLETYLLLFLLLLYGFVHFNMSKCQYYRFSGPANIADRTATSQRLHVASSRQTFLGQSIQSPL